MDTLYTKHFYMIRHGETVANAEGYAAGSLDTPLTDQGYKQALEASSILETLTIQPGLIVHSHLSRAKETARILNENLKLPMKECASLAEQCFGDWAWMPWAIVNDLIKTGTPPPNGESTETFTRRVVNGLTEATKLHDKPTLIVTHGGVFDALMRNYTHKITEVQNCHLYEFIPNAQRTGLPWEIWHHRYSEGGRVKADYSAI